MHIANAFVFARNVFGFVAAIAPVPGVAVGVSVAAEIVQSCEDVAYQRARAQAIGRKSLQLEVALEEASHGMEGTAWQKRADEVQSLLERIRRRAQRWRDRKRVVQWYARWEMNKEMDRSIQELDTAMESLNIANQADIIRGVREVQEQGVYHFKQIQEILLKLADGKPSTRELLGLQSESGTSDMAGLVRNGQRALKEMREESNTSSSPSTEPSSSAAVPNNSKSAQKYRNMQRGLANLLKETSILPPEKCLDDEVQLTGDIAVIGGSSCDIWRGTWLGEKQVALKAMRHMRVDDETAKRRIVRESEIWSILLNDHILPFYGYVTNLSSHFYLVSPWLNNGSVLDYMKEHPNIDKLHLLRGAAEGLRYLHSKDIVHGNIKCSNIMVSDSGEACISDFGMAKMIEEMSNMPLSTTIARAGSTRWLAPEIVEGNSPSKASDTYSFGMAILELLTGKKPFIEHRADATVIRALVVQKEKPERPAGAEIEKWLTDDVWNLMLRCWEWEPKSRPAMEEVVCVLNKCRCSNVM